MSTPHPATFAPRPAGTEDLGPHHPSSPVSAKEAAVKTTTKQQVNPLAKPSRPTHRSSLAIKNTTSRVPIHARAHSGTETKASTDSALTNALWQSNMETEKRFITDTGSLSKTSSSPPPPPPPPLPRDGSMPVYPLLPRVMSALFYAVSATLIVVVNKMVLTSYRFPSFLVLGLGQMIMTIVLLSVLRLVGVVHFPSPHRHIFRQVWPLPLLFLGCVVFSLGGTKKLSIPMYVVLRRFGNLFIMLAEYLILGQAAPLFIQLTVYLMILGAFVAAADDLAFDLGGYAFILVTNVLAALNGVITKQKLNNNALGTYGLMFYNSLVMVLPATALAFLTGDLHKTWDYSDLGNAGFQLLFAVACVMGFLVTFSTLLSTKYNSPLTTSIVGVLKNVIVVYSGMIIGGDYIYSFLNFLGINISMVGGFMYSYAAFISKSRAPSSSGVTKV